MTDRHAATAAAKQVASIIEAAERAAEQLRADAERRVRDRIAEAERAAANRLRAAEQEADEILAGARAAAERLLREAEAEAERTISKATDRGLVIVADAERAAVATHTEAAAQIGEWLTEARHTVDSVRGEGGLVVANIRELGTSLRTNAERLLRDIQAIHARLRAELAQVEGPGRGARGAHLRATEAGTGEPAQANPRADVAQGGAPDRPHAQQDIPEFIPPEPEFIPPD